MSEISEVLAARGERYGNFMEHAQITQALKDFCRSGECVTTSVAAARIESRWAIMEEDQREALDMIAHKIGRILNGDPHYSDSWIDIAGYAKLVADRLEAREAEARR